MTSDQTIKRADRAIAATYSRFPIVLTEGKGCTLTDAEGRTYTDFVAGIAVCNLGHAHEGIAKAVAEQARRLVHVSNLYYTEPQTELAEWLVEHSFADRVFSATAALRQTKQPSSWHGSISMTAEPVTGSGS